MIPGLRYLIWAVACGAIASCAPPAATGPASGLTFRVAMPDSRKIALVAPSAYLATIADIEAAARKESGCRATAIDRVYTAAAQDRSMILPSSLYLGFGGQLPVTLDCA